MQQVMIKDKDGYSPTSEVVDTTKRGLHVVDAAANLSLASMASVSDLVDLGGAQRLPGNGASQALTVPANALIMRVDAEGGAVRISHTGAASATTIPRVPEEAIDYIPLKSTDAPQFFGASASVIANINYYGART